MLSRVFWKEDPASRGACLWWYYLNDGGLVYHGNQKPESERHPRAKAVAATSAHIRVVQEALGHAHLSTTEIYTHVRVDTQQAAANRIEYLSTTPDRDDGT